MAYAKGGKEIGRATLRTAGPALQLHAHSETAALKADGVDLAYIHFLLADENGVVKSELAHRDPPAGNKAARAVSQSEGTMPHTQGGKR